MTAIHQIVAGFAHGDAISNESIVMRDIFRSWGFQSDIFCEKKRILPELRGNARDLAECSAACGPDDVGLLHLSIGSDANDLFQTLRCKKAILYHNITPSHYFDLINKPTASCLEKGRRQTAMLANAAQVNMADSKFNAGELVQLGYKNVQVLPLVLDLKRLKDNPDKRTLRAYSDGKTNILFVGRCVPNKKIEDVIRTFFCFYKAVEPHSRLILVGSFAGAERYHNLLLTQARELEISDIRFTSSIPQSQLNAIYQTAHLFLSMSEHEGFCIPVIESMVHDVPVMAYAAAAVPETMDSAGVLFREKSPELVAEMMGRILRDSALRSAIIAKQRERIARYTGRDLVSELKQMLGPLICS